MRTKIKKMIRNMTDVSEFRGFLLASFFLISGLALLGGVAIYHSMTFAYIYYAETFVGVCLLLPNNTLINRAYIVLVAAAFSSFTTFLVAAIIESIFIFVLGHIIVIAAIITALCCMEIDKTRQINKS
ncbi:MAG: hypothetical protein LBI60_02605 [Bacteroidales bacterium]|jgi:hypothetical protein|nr:hypothetical protein [Bacteroidales bacterium]